VALLGGRPLLAWTVGAALESGVFAEVLVSSDDDEVLAAAAAAGAAPLRRDPALAGDRTSLEAVLADAIETRGLAGAVALLLPTAPLVSAATLQAGWRLFRESGAEAVLSVSPLHHPPQWALTTAADGTLVPLDPAGYDVPRQDLPPALQHDGAFAFLDVGAFVRSGSYFGGRALPFETPRDEAVDVDDPVDLEWAAFLLERRAPRGL
jgi:N-acylneuraminate cytidylyltransferase